MPSTETKSHGPRTEDNKRGRNPERRKQKEEEKSPEQKAEEARVREKREQIKKAVDEALKYTREALAMKNLPEAEKARLRWSLKAVENAKKESLDKDLARYDIDKDRREGVPVDELYRTVMSRLDVEKSKIHQVQKKQKLRDQSSLARSKHTMAKGEAAGAGEDEQKLVWRKAFAELPENSELAVETKALVAKWETAERSARGSDWPGYNEQEKNLQLGQALKALTEKYEKEDEAKMRKQLELHKEGLANLEKLKQAFEENSSNYFSHHFKKEASQLTKEDRDKQHKYTEREANLIANDKDYRKFLEERYRILNKLEPNFDSLKKEDQDYKLAMLSLERRRVLTMPSFRKVEKKFSQRATQQDGQPTTTTGTRTETGVTYRLRQPGTEPTAPTGPKPTTLTKITGNVDQVPRTPETIKTPEVPKKLFLIDLSEIAKRMAWTQAEERLQKEYKGMNMFKRALKGLTEDKRRIEYREDALRRIKADNNLMAAISERISGKPSVDSKTPISPEYLKLLDGAVAEYEKEVVDSQRELGETVNKDPRVQSALKELLLAHANNSWKDMPGEIRNLSGREAVEYFVKNKIVPLLEGKNWSNDPSQQSERKGFLFASNFFNIAESYKNFLVEQKRAAGGELNEVGREAVNKHMEGILNLELQLGYKERDLVNNRPKGILNFYERMVSWAEGAKVDQRTGKLEPIHSMPKRVIGKILLNPFAMGIAATATSRVTQTALRWSLIGSGAALGASGFWLPVGAGALAGGAFRAFKRSKDVKYDIAQELRNETLGGQGSEILGGKVDYSIFGKKLFNVRDAGNLRYEGAVKSFKEAKDIVDSLKGKKGQLTEQEKEKLAKIYARLELERDMFRSTDKSFTKVDLFALDEAAGKDFGSTVSAKSDLRIALSDLGFSEQNMENLAGVRGIIASEKSNILDIIKNTNRKQESFRRWEAGVAGVNGAVLGTAGSIGTQSIINLGGEQVEKLWGGSYFKNHTTVLGQAREWAKGSDYYQKYFGHPDVHTVAMSHGRSPAEYLNSLRGNVSGGEVGGVHTVSHYDNPTTEIPHAHNANELKFYISKDASENFHFKVPVEQGGSWLMNGRELEQADLDKAFADGNIKMIFVPDGASPHEGVVLDVDAITKEVIIPKDSNLRGLFDDNGRLKGTGYFGLAEKVGTRADGSGNYVWINSEKGNGSLDFGKVVEQVPDDNYVAKGPQPMEEWSAIPTVPLTRKVWLRPEERAAIIERQRKAKEEKAKKKAEKQKGSGGHSEHEHGHGGEHGSETELRKENPDAFDREKMKVYRNTFQKSLTQEEKAAAGINFDIIQAFLDEEVKALEKIKQKEAAEKKAAAEAAKHAKGHGHGHGKGHGGGHDHGHAPAVKKELAVVHEEGPGMEEYLAEVKKLKNAIEHREKHFAEIADTHKKLLELKAGTSDDFKADVDKLSARFKELTTKDWNDKFDPVKFRRDYEEKLRPILKTVEEKKPAANAAARGRAGNQPEADNNEATEADDDAEPEKGKKKETEQEDLDKAIKAFKAKFKTVDLEIGRNWQGQLKFKEKSVKDFQTTFFELSKNASFKPGKIKIILTTAEKPSIRNGVWILPAKVTAEQIKQVLQGGQRDRGPKKKPRKQAA